MSNEQSQHQMQTQTQPLSQHWADQTAFRIVKQLGHKDVYTLAAGITPSGVVHIGNFREVFTVDLVARALKDLGKNVRFIYSWDDFDTFRKVPANLPNPDDWKQYLRMSISQVPDPWGKEKSYARANEVRFEHELEPVGIRPQFIYQHEKYENGDYAESMRFALENKDKIAAILNAHRSEPLDASWLPTAIFCEKCGKDEMKDESYGKEWSYHYECASCGHKATTDIRTCKTLKLNWRTDWPMRWAYESVDFEPGGKDHSSQGGSFDTGKEIVKQLWNREAPIYLQYDFVSIKGLPGKMSSSSGNLITLGQSLDVYTPQMVRWIFTMQRNNHDFSLAFDEDVIRVYEEFDRSEASALDPSADRTDKKWLQNRRLYELSLTEHGVVPASRPFRPNFRSLCNHLQICDGNINRTLEKFYKNQASSQLDRDSFAERSEKALIWLEHYAPEGFRYKLRGHSDPNPTLKTQEKAALRSLKELVESCELDTIEPKELNEKIYAQVIHSNNFEPTDFFKVCYQTLIARDQGPRLPTFLKEIGAERLGQILHFTTL